MRWNFSRKAANYWNVKIKKRKDNPRDLWSTINSLLGNKIRPEMTNLIAEDFHWFFNKKVDNIRADTAVAPALTFEPSSSCNLRVFNEITVNRVIELIHIAPSKQSNIYPIPTWIVKDCINKFVQFIFILIYGQQRWQMSKFWPPSLLALSGDV